MVELIMSLNIGNNTKSFKEFVMCEAPYYNFTFTSNDGTEVYDRGDYMFEKPYAGAISYYLIAYLTYAKEMIKQTGMSAKEVYEIWERTHQELIGPESHPQDVLQSIQLAKLYLKSEKRKIEEEYDVKFSDEDPITQDSIDMYLQSFNDPNAGLLNPSMQIFRPIKDNVFNQETKDFFSKILPEKYKIKLQSS